MADLGPCERSTGLPETVQAVEQGRRFAQGTLAEAGYRGSHEDILLIVSELITNALRHGAGAPQLTVQVSADGTRVRLEVADESPTLPAPRAGGPDGGFGLLVISRLGRWGTVPRGEGKAVWCEVGATLAADPADTASSPTGRTQTPGVAVSL